MTIEIGGRIVVCEQILEVRYVASGAFLNKTGELADYIREKKLFSHWKIDTNRVDFQEAEDQKTGAKAFVSFKNAGLVVSDPPTQNFYKDKAVQYWKALEENKVFKIPEIQRIGVRFRCFVRLDADFSEIERKMFSSLCRDAVGKIFGGNRKDLQVVLDYREVNSLVRFTTGPIKKDEASKLFNFESTQFSGSGVFIDIDRHTSVDIGIRGTVPSFIGEASALTWKNVEEALKEMGL